MDLKTDSDTGLIEPTFTKADRKSIAAVADLLDDLHTSAVKNAQTANEDVPTLVARLSEAATTCRAVLAGAAATLDEPKADAAGKEGTDAPE